jgi:uncharacterized membrane-anchored protein
MKVRWPLVAVVLPITVMALWLAALSLAIARGTEVSLKVTGYDPRDLLRGHYLQYRVDYGFDFTSVNERDGRPQCLCLSIGPEGFAKATSVSRCEERNESTCPLFIKGTLDWRGFAAGIERYYFPENYQQWLQLVPPEATIKVSVTKDGNAYVRGMYVAGEPILEYARRKERE